MTLMRLTVLIYGGYYYVRIALTEHYSKHTDNISRKVLDTQVGGFSPR